METLNVGDTGPDWTLPALTRTDLVRYAGASGDLNPMHHDDEIARSMGLPSVFAHGMLTAGILSTYLVRWLGVGSLRKFKVRFRERVWPGDTLTCHATVTAVHEPEAGGGEALVDLDLSVLRQDGSVALSGTATAAV